MKKALYLTPLLLFLKSPFKMNEILQKPSIHHILGTDNLGRDIFSRLVFGTLNTMLIVFVSIIIVTIIGTIIGSISGYYGGILDMFLQTIIEILLSIPSILVAIAVVVIIGSGYKSLITAIILMYLPSVVNYARGLILKEKNKEYITAAKTYGVKNFRIIRKHIFPNIKRYLMLNFVINFSKAILTEAGLGFLGIGIDPSIPTLGNMLNTAQSYFLIAPWFTLAPGITIIIIVYIANEITKKKGSKNGKKVRN